MNEVVDTALDRTALEAAARRAGARRRRARHLQDPVRPRGDGEGQRPPAPAPLHQQLLPRGLRAARRQGEGARARPVPAHPCPGRHPSAGARHGPPPDAGPRVRAGRLRQDAHQPAGPGPRRVRLPRAPAARRDDRPADGAPPRPAPAGRRPRGRHRSRHRPAGARDARAHHHRRPDALGRPAADHLAPHGVRRAAARRQLDPRRPGALPRLRPRDRRRDRRGRRCPQGVLAHRRARGPRGLLRDRRPRARAPRRGADADRGRGSPRPSPP